MNAAQRRALKRVPLQPDARETPSELVEITRSFSMKLNLGRFSKDHQYESADFFCAQKAQHRREDELPANEALYSFCKKAVMADRQAFIKEFRAHIAEKKGSK